MKPLICVPPAQAEALYDTQDELRDDLRLDDRVTRLPWRDDESLDEPLSYSLAQPIGKNPPGRRVHSVQPRP